MSKINQNVLFSVSDRTGLVGLAKAFSDFGYELIATGKTCQYLSENNLDAKDVSGVTGFPEILDGRVKTLHPHIHGGILARRDLNDHMDELKKLDINSIDVVVVNIPLISVIISISFNFFLTYFSRLKSQSQVILATVDSIKNSSFIVCFIPYPFMDELVI